MKTGEGVFFRAAALFAGGFLVSVLVGNLAMDLRMYVLTRFGGVYSSLAAYYAVHYVLFQLTLIAVVYLVLHGSRLTRTQEALAMVVLTAGKLLGRAGFEAAPTPAQLLFSLVISTQLSMASLLLGYSLHAHRPASAEVRKSDWSLETYAGMAVLFWFALMPGVDALGSDLYSNLLRTGMAISLVGVACRFFNGWENPVRRVVLLTAFCLAGLVIASLFADILWRAGTLTVLPPPENLYYLAAQASQGFFLALAASGGIWLNLLLQRVRQVAAPTAKPAG